MLVSAIVSLKILVKATADNAYIMQNEESCQMNSTIFVCKLSDIYMHLTSCEKLMRHCGPNWNQLNCVTCKIRLDI
jgi:hypothetical protein